MIYILIFLSAFRGSDPAARELLVKHIGAACRDKGFFQLTNHGIPSEMQEAVFAACKEFFDLPLVEKLKLDIKASRYNRGYEVLGAQMLEPGSAPDTKEGLYIGEHLPLDHPRVLAKEHNCGPNIWPELLGEPFEKTCMAYYYAVREYAST